MPKTCDVPVELRDFNKIFERISYRHDSGTAFDDFLTIMMNFFNMNCQPLELKRYERRDIDAFNELLHEFLHVRKVASETRDWSDELGTFYEVLAGGCKRSSFGQFFTPVHLCTLSAKMTANSSCSGNFVNDPACGSGRMLVAFHIQSKGNYLFGEDLDPMCCKMAALNLMFHGCVGEVININSISRDSYRGGWRINPILYSSGIPCIQTITANESFSWCGFVSHQFKRRNTSEQGRSETGNTDRSSGDGSGIYAYKGRAERDEITVSKSGAQRHQCLMQY
jgi:type I restriction enzyme M protein